MSVHVCRSSERTSEQFPKQSQSVLHAQVGVLKIIFLFLPASIKSQKHIRSTKVFSAIVIIHYVVNRLVPRNVESHSPHNAILVSSVRESVITHYLISFYICHGEVRLQDCDENFTPFPSRTKFPNQNILCLNSRGSVCVCVCVCDSAKSHRSAHPMLGECYLQRYICHLHEHASCPFEKPSRSPKEDSFLITMTS